MGDGSNDLMMLRAAGVGIAYKPKPIVKKEIKTQINYSDLSCTRFFF